MQRASERIAFHWRVSYDFVSIVTKHFDMTSHTKKKLSSVKITPGTTKTESETLFPTHLSDVDPVPAQL